MSDQKRWRRVLPVILLAGALLRVWVFLESREWIIFRMPILDAGFYHETAQALLRGEWPGREPYFMGPLYTYLLGGIYTLFGPELELVRLLHMALGLTGAWLAARAARHLFGTTAGLITAGLAVFYGPFLFYEQLPLMTTLLTVAAVALYDRSVAFRERGGWLSALAVGLVAGILMALRLSAALYLIPVAILVGRSRLRSGRALLALAVSLLVLAPFTWHNLRTGSRSILSTNLGWNLYIGNGTTSSGTFAYPNGWRAEEDPTGSQFASQQAGRRLSADETNRYWLSRTLAALRERPARLVTLAVRKLYLIAHPEEIPQNENFRFFRITIRPARAGVIGWWLILPLALLGFWAPASSTRLKLGAVGFALVPVAVCLVFFVTSRYRMPASPFLAVLAGGGVGALLRRRPEVRRGFQMGAILAAGLAVLLLLLPPPIRVSAALAREYEHLGLRYQKLGAYRTAEEQYRRALALDATDGDAHNNLGTVLIQLGRPGEAEAAFLQAARYQPSNPVPLLNLGLLLGGQDRDAEAERYLRRAVTLDPTNASLFLNLGTALARQTKLAEAIACYEEAVRLDPDDAQARDLLLRARELLEAIESGQGMP